MFSIGFHRFSIGLQYVFYKGFIGLYSFSIDFHRFSICFHRFSIGFL